MIFYKYKSNIISVLTLNKYSGEFSILKENIKGLYLFIVELGKIFFLENDNSLNRYSVYPSILY
jgi:hypothetical protein